MTDMEKIKARAKAEGDRLKAQVDSMEAKMDQMNKMFAERVKLAGIEQKADSAEAQQEIDRLQAVTQLRQ